MRKLRRPHLLPRGIHVAHHEMLGDFLHVLKVEEGVEAELVCKDTPLSATAWLREARTGVRVVGQLSQR